MMPSMETSFVGLDLQSPIIVASSGLTTKLDRVRSYADAGAGAVVVKSIFEEQIQAHSQHLEVGNEYPEALDYLSTYVRQQEVGKHLELIEQLSSGVSIPIIASINCLHQDSWTDFALQLQEAGARAIELNIMRLETDLFFDPIESERSYVDILQAVSSRVSIPVLVKLSKYHTSLPHLIDKLRASGADGVTLFNRSYQPDIDLDDEVMTSAEVFTHAGDFADTLRFTGLVSGLVPRMPISASCGIHTWQEVVKALLSGASTTQMCTAIYREGAGAITRAIEGVQGWMQEHGYRAVEEFRGRLSASNEVSASHLERVQFMKYFGSKQPF